MTLTGTEPLGMTGENTMDELINTKNKKQIRQKPPLSLGRITSEILGGMGMGFPVKLLAACIGGIVFLGVGGEADTRMAFMTTLSKVTLVVYGIVCTVGVYLVGSRGKRTGSFLLTLAFGFLSGLLVIAMLSLVRVTRVLLIRYVLELLTQPIAATVGFNLTRRYKDSTKAIDESIDIEDEMQSSQKPPINRSRVVVEILAGMALGFVATLAVYGIIVVFFGGRDYSGSVGQLQALGIVGIFISVVPLFYGLGSAVGVYFVSRRGNQTGSFLATLGGGFLGGLVTIGMLPLAITSFSIVELAILVWIFLFLPLVLLGAPIMATIGFNLTRRYKKPPSS